MMRSFFAILERAAALAQGKGFGSNTVRREVRAAASLLKSDAALVIDIGGNKGLYTEAIRESFPNAEVHVFEPAKANLAILAQKFAKDQRIVIESSALSNRSGQAMLHADEAGSGMASLSDRRVTHHGLDFTHQEPVATTRFDDYWATKLGKRRVDIAKLDVEGHELAVLEGFGEAIAHVALVQFEFGGCNIDTRTYFQDFWYFFLEHRFSIYRIAPLSLQKIERYHEMEECFVTTNFLALRQR